MARATASSTGKIRPSMLEFMDAVAINAVLLLAVGGFVLFEAIERFFTALLKCLTASPMLVRVCSGLNSINSRMIRKM